MSTPPVFLYYSELLGCQHLGQGFVWCITVILLIHLTVFQIFGMCRHCVVGLSCHHDRIWCKGSGGLVPLDTEARERVDDIGLSWFVEGSSFNSVCSVISFGRSAEGHCTGFSSKDTSFPYSWKLASRSMWMEALQRYFVTVPFTAMFPSHQDTAVPRC